MVQNNIANLIAENKKIQNEATRKDDEHMHQSCYSKRDTAQILALFSGNSVSKSEEKSDDFDVLQACPQSSSSSSLSEVSYVNDDDDDDTKDFFQSSSVDPSKYDDISYNSPASPVSLQSAVLNKPHCNSLVVCENYNCNDLSGDDLFQVPHIDTEHHQSEPSPSSNITRFRESTIVSRKEHQKVCLQSSF